MNERIPLMKSVFSDEAFVRTLLEAENAETVQQMLAGKGLDMSLTEIELMGEMLEGLKDGKFTAEQLERLSAGGELSDDELEAAAGGNLEHYIVNRLSAAEEVRNSVQSAASTFENTSNTTLHVVGCIVCGTLLAANVAIGVYDYIRTRW